MTKNQLRAIMGANIRNERMARNMSIDDLAELLNLTPGFVGSIERGIRGATPNTLYKLADIFDISLDVIFSTSNQRASSILENEPKSKVKRNKVTSLIADLTENELDFVIRMVKNIKKMNHVPVYENDEDEFDMDE